MTITTNDDRDEYTATAGQTVFNYTFKIYSTTDLNVYQTPAVRSFDDAADIITGYTVSGVGSSSGGTITLNTGAAAGDRITIVSAIPSSRTTDYQNNGDFTPATVNDDFDRSVSLVKQAEGIGRRALLFPESQQNTQALKLPSPEAGRLLRWTSNLDGLENTDLTGISFDAVVKHERHTATAGQTVFTLANEYTATQGGAGIAVVVNGSKFGPPDYGQTNSTTVTFNNGLSAGDIVDFYIGEFVDTLNLRSQDVGHTANFTGATSRNVRAKLDERVSVKDFGASGNGGSSDAAAIQEALNVARALADANSDAHDVYEVEVPPGIYRLSTDLTIPKRITMSCAGVKFNLDAGVTIIGGQDAHFAADRNTQVIMATGHTGNAFEKDANVGAFHITGWPLIKSTDAAAQTGAALGNIAVNMTRVKDSLIEVKIDDCGTHIYIDAQSASDTCYYNEIHLHSENYNFGIYSIGEYSNGNAFHIRRLSDGHDAITYIPGTSSIAGSGNLFYGGFCENILNYGINLDDALQNTFTGLTLEGLGTPVAGINLAGACEDNTFVNVNTGGQFASSTKSLIQASGCLRTTWIGGKYSDLINVSGAITTLDAFGSRITQQAEFMNYATVTGTTATVNVDSVGVVYMNHSSATDFTDFLITSSVSGMRVLWVYCGTANTTFKDGTGNLEMSTNADVNPAAGSWLIFLRPGQGISTDWRGHQVF